MGEFKADWLALREPADATARSGALTAEVAERLAAMPGEYAILDLATGTGANVRYLAERLPSPQHWRLADRDQQLLAQVLPRLSAWATSRGAILSGNPSGVSISGPTLACRIDARRVDLARLAGDELFSGSALVTASALLDLVSARWLDDLAARCRRAGAIVLFALTYDGRWSCTPADPEDAVVHRLVNRHQHSVKGFGRALGPEANDYAERAFEAVGYEVRTMSTDWHVSPQQGALQRALIDGWASAASEMDPDSAHAITAWKVRRLARVAEGGSQIVVGHVDLAGWVR